MTGTITKLSKTTVVSTDQQTSQSIDCFSSGAAVLARLLCFIVTIKPQIFFEWVIPDIKIQFSYGLDVLQDTERRHSSMQ